MVVSHPCVLCTKSVKRNQKALLCTQCNLWVHIKCASVPEQQYLNPNEHFVNWNCPKCTLSVLPFFNENDIADALDSPEKQLDVSNFDKQNQSDVLNCVTEENNDYCFPKEKGMKFSHLNIRSLRNKKDDLGMFLRDNPYDLLGLSETWLEEYISDSLIAISGYNFERKDRQEHGGGVCCYIRSNVSYIRRHDLENDELELLWLEIKPKNETRIFVGTIYRQPNSPMSFFDSLEDNLDRVSALSERVLLLGDLNCNMLTTNSLSKRLNELEILIGLKQLIQEPTRVTPNSSTLIDLILVSNSFGALQCGVQPIGFSDHSLVYTLTKTSANMFTPKISRFRSFRKFNETAFLDELAAIKWNELLKANNDVDSKWSTFHSLFLKLCDKHAPYVTMRPKIKGSPWINTQYIEISRERDFFKRKFLKTRDPAYYNQFKSFRNRANTLNKKLKRAFVKEKLQNVGNELKKRWKVLNALLPNNRSNNKSNIIIEE